MTYVVHPVLVTFRGRIGDSICKIQLKVPLADWSLYMLILVDSFPGRLKPLYVDISRQFPWPIEAFIC